MKNHLPLLILSALAVGLLLASAGAAAAEEPVPAAADTEVVQEAASSTAPASTSEAVKPESWVLFRTIMMSGNGQGSGKPNGPRIEFSPEIGAQCFGSCDCNSCTCDSGSCSLSECQDGCNECWRSLRRSC